MLRLTLTLFVFFRLSLLYSIPLEEKIGQMLVVGFRETELYPDHPFASPLSKGHLGGVILYDYDQTLKAFQRNILSSEQLKKLTAQLQNLSPQKLLIAIDQEGGYVSRLNLKNGFLATSSAAILGKGSIFDTFQESLCTATLLATLGINVNFAPVVDLSLNPKGPIYTKERSYSKDPLLVVAHATAMIEGHHQRGILTTLKHFPGHGSSENDSHLGFVDITKTWSKKELLPYQELMLLSPHDLIMTAHVYHADLDPHYPASLSENIITGLLRHSLGFKGVIITDDLQMKAIRDNYTLKESVYLAIQAGSDLLLFANNEVYDEEIVATVINSIKEMIDDGKLTLERIEESYERIQRLKERLKQNGKVLPG